MTPLTLAALALTWAGASVLVLTDGRRGLGSGILAGGGGVAATLALAGSAPAAAAVAVGALVAAAARQRSGRPGWAPLPPGSTPRVLLCVAGGSAAVVVGTTIGAGPVVPAALLLGSLSTGRLLSASATAPALACAAAAALGLSVAVAAVSTAAVLPVAICAAAAAIVVSALPVRADG